MDYDKHDLERDELKAENEKLKEQIKTNKFTVDYDSGIISVNGHEIADHSELPKENKRLFEENQRLRERIGRLRGALLIACEDYMSGDMRCAHRVDKALAQDAAAEN